MLRIETPRTLIADNIHDAVEYIRTTPRRWRADSSQSNESSYDWDLRAGWSKALDLYRTGWPDGRMLMEQAKPAEITHRRHERVYGMAGGAVDVGRMLTGNPMHMVSTRKRRIPRPVVKLLLNLGALAYVQSNCFVNFGVAIVELINQLEENGQRIEVDLVFTGRQNGTHCHVGWGLKKADDYLDLDQLAFGIAHPAAFRRIGFALLERLDRRYEDWGYGTRANMTPEDLELVQAPADTVLIDGARIWDKCHTLQSAREALAVIMEQNQ